MFRSKPEMKLQITSAPVTTRDVTDSTSKFYLHSLYTSQEILSSLTTSARERRNFTTSCFAKSFRESAHIRGYVGCVILNEKNEAELTFDTVFLRTNNKMRLVLVK